MNDKPLAIYSPWHLLSSEPPDLSSPAYRFLAEGDSWFSIGSLNPAKNSNLLFEMAFEQSACAINCASPGDTLRRMSQINADPNFVNLLCGKIARNWDALLLSCGGNDLIDAVQSFGPSVPLKLRLLCTPSEWGDESLGAERFVSNDGWQTFADYLQANLAVLIGLRDKGPSKGCPVFLHGYAFATPRPAPAIAKIGPWLFPTLVAAAIPTDQLIPLATLLQKRLAALLAASAADSARFPNLHFFDTTVIPVVPAALGSTGEDGDWVNEIHLTWRGYEKLALPWSAFIEKTLRGG